MLTSGDHARSRRGQPGLTWADLTFKDHRRLSAMSPFLSRVSILTRDIDIANMSVCPSVRPSVRNLVSDENSLTYCHSFFFTVR